tara:strand:+ start:1488 stop:1700 length:213 start_codon:yes stop_codon:yes gene_type:complete
MTSKEEQLQRLKEELVDVEDSIDNTQSRYMDNQERAELRKYKIRLNEIEQELVLLEDPFAGVPDLGFGEE